jgi:hypothetical protein
LLAALDFQKPRFGHACRLGRLIHATPTISPNNSPNLSSTHENELKAERFVFLFQTKASHAFASTSGQFNAFDLSKK